MQLIFDRICIQKPDSSQECFDPTAFARVPLSERIKCVLEKRISFFKQGNLLDSREALRNYREWSATLRQ
jgi:hypothetical protein